MGSTAKAAAQGPAERLGFTPGQIVMELGYDEDVDHDFRDAVEDVINSELEDEEYNGVADAVLLWWRDGDGDLIDDCVDALTPLAEGGFVVLLTPKATRPDHVEASDIEEAANTAGMNASGSLSAGAEWHARRLAAPRSARR